MKKKTKRNIMSIFLIIVFVFISVILADKSYNLKNYESDDYLNWSKNYRLLFVKYEKRTFSPPTRVVDSD